MITPRQFTRVLNMSLDGYGVMLRRYPKAAKKARNRTKWKNMYPHSLTLNYFLPNPILSKFKESSYSGKYIGVPLTYSLIEEQHVRKPT